MRKPYTPDDLRILSKQSGPQWDGEVKVALRFAADLLDAADLAVKSTQPPQADTQRVPMTKDEVQDQMTDLARSAYEEAMSFGLSLDTFTRYMRSVVSVAEAHHGIKP